MSTLSNHTKAFGSVLPQQAYGGEFAKLIVLPRIDNFCHSHWHHTFFIVAAWLLKCHKRLGVVSCVVYVIYFPLTSNFFNTINKVLSSYELKHGF